MPEDLLQTFTPTQEALDAMRLERDRFAFENIELQRKISSLKDIVRGEQEAKAKALTALETARAGWDSTLKTKDALVSMVGIPPDDAQVARALRQHLGNLVARLDGDGGHKQDADTSLDETVDRADAEIVRLLGVETELRTEDGVLAVIRAYLPTLTDTQREEFFYLMERGYCTNCGRKLEVDERHCQCTNDE